jgi:hypothetical protein
MHDVTRQSHRHPSRFSTLAPVDGTNSTDVDW